MLEGLKIIELATYIAAPGAAGIMTDWGAEVIKIEQPGGDPIRKFFDSIGSDQAANPVFELDNRGKKSIVLDPRPWRKPSRPARFRSKTFEEPTTRRSKSWSISPSLPLLDSN